MSCRRLLLGGGLWLLTSGTLAAQAQPPRAPALLPPAQMPTLPLTQLDDRARAPDLENKTFTLTFAQPLPIKDLLLLLVRGTNLSVVPDPSVTGSFIGELKNVTVGRALELILPPLGLDYDVEGGFIRVFKRQPETRLFDVNYIATDRTGHASIGLDGAAGGGSAFVSTTTTTDLFGDLTKGVQTLLSDRGRFNVDRKAGLLQITDFPERLERVAIYLDAVQDRVHRQVQIEARIVEVELSDVAAQGVDWAALAQANANARSPAAFPTGAPRAGFAGLRVTDVATFMTALAVQGKVSILASPRLLAMNNEPAIVRMAEEQQVSGKHERGGVPSDALTLSVTPQIGQDGTVMLSLSPILARGVRDKDGRPAGARAFLEADTLARVADGETVVISGPTRDREIRERRAAGVTGGWFGRSTVVINKRTEMLILLTPKILHSAISQ